MAETWDLERAKEMYAGGATLDEVARTFGLTPDSARESLRKAGLREDDEAEEAEGR